MAKTLQTQLDKKIRDAKKKKEYVEGEFENKNDRLSRVRDNLDVLRDLFND